MITVIVSGYFNPLHVGHLDYFEAAKRLGDRLWVIVNNDTQVALKGSVPFMTALDRFRIVNSLEVVDMAFLSADEDRSVCETLRKVVLDARRDNWSMVWKHEFIFANGGDATKDTVPENDVCDKLGIKAVYGVVPQLRESSKILAAAGVTK